MLSWASLSPSSYLSVPCLNSRVTQHGGPQKATSQRIIPCREWVGDVEWMSNHKRHDKEEMEVREMEIS